MELETGNAGEVDTNGTGWFIGFSDWTEAGDANLRHMPSELDARVFASSGFCTLPGIRAASPSHLRRANGSHTGWPVRLVPDRVLSVEILYTQNS